MVGNTLVQIPACPSLSSSTLTTLPHSSPKVLPCLPPKLRMRLAKVRAMSASTEHNPQPGSSEQKNLLAVVLDILRNIWRQTLRPLSDFGFGRRSIWEGGVGLFLVSGTVEDDKIIIPRNSLIEVNQSGLLMETLIDITPRDPIPSPSVGPLDAECVKEGLIVCDRQKIKGEQGVNLDALVGIVTRLARQMEEIGIANSYSLAERVAAVIQDAKPLLTKIEAMAEDVQPLLSELRDSGLLQEVENLTRSLTQASEDLR
ncbi:hypothetical protein ES319_A08G079500v1 [Gossypium barbadense]|uniref:Mce/MlaD domain-containing protein n=2 Tax=Gossypium TaxID=3633 RepID=A0A5J5UN43_GOSBA|nr:hypothetical protein ES319_A08G079500v1 [Gossypium barbadense]TYH05458.1 hypothetical protein ES288_A08G085000v1 [Gossypium darwinii]